MKKKPNYGIDAPVVIRNFFLIGVFFIILAIFIYNKSYYFLIKLLSILILISGLYCFIVSILMILSSKFGKYYQAKRLINLLNIKGNETILDVGCGRGLLLIEIAKKLTTGKVIGIDIWNKYDLSGNSKGATLKNIKIESVENKTELIDSDIRATPFNSQYFDIIVSSLVLHNISNDSERKKAIEEMTRILKPNGIILIQDFLYTNQYNKILQDLGFHVIVFPLNFFIFPPVRIVQAKDKI